MTEGSFTLGKLKECARMLEAIPPIPMFASWDQFPRDHALKFTWDGKEYVGAHPDFWKKIPASERGQVQSLFALEIADFSLPYYRGKKAEFMGLWPGRSRQPRGSRMAEYKPILERYAARYSDGFDRRKLYQFRRLDGEDIGTFRLSDQGEYFNVAGLLYRDPTD